MAASASRSTKRRSIFLPMWTNAMVDLVMRISMLIERGFICQHCGVEIDGALTESVRSCGTCQAAALVSEEATSISDQLLMPRDPLNDKCVIKVRVAGDLADLQPAAKHVTEFPSRKASVLVSTFDAEHKPKVAVGHDIVCFVRELDLPRASVQITREIKPV